MFKGWRTIIINVLLSILPLIEVVGTLLNMPEMRGVIPPEYLPWYGLAVAIINMILRKLTTTPLGKKM